VTDWANPPAWYDVLNPWGPSDDFYLELVMAAGGVLDVGCGTGTLLHRARDAGHPGRLCGLDPDPTILDQARTAATSVGPGRRHQARARRARPATRPVPAAS
jgi:SAM-dependent methyltransferase